MSLHSKNGASLIGLPTKSFFRASCLAKVCANEGFFFSLTSSICLFSCCCGSTRVVYCQYKIAPNRRAGNSTPRNRYRGEKKRRPLVKRAAKSVFAPFVRVIPAVRKKRRAVCQHAIGFCWRILVPAMYNVASSKRSEKAKWSGTITASIIEEKEKSSAANRMESVRESPVSSLNMR